MAGKRRIGSSWQALTGTGPYYKKDSAISRLFSGESNVLGRRAKKVEPSEVSVTARKRSAPVADVPKSAPSEVGVTARKRKMPVSDLPETPPVKAASKPTPKPAAKPKAAAPKVDRMKEFMGSLSEDNAVLKKLRERGFKKGGSIDGCVTKGKTKGRYI